MRALILLACLSAFSTASADCMAPFGVGGSLRHIDMASNSQFHLYSCNGSSWQSVEISNTTNACTVPGQIIYNIPSQDIQVCSTVTVGTYNWFSTKSSTTGGSCTSAGKISYPPGGRHVFCGGTSEYFLGASAAILLTSPPSASENCVPGSMTLDSTVITVENTGGSTMNGVTVTSSSPGTYPIINDLCAIGNLTPGQTCQAELQYGFVMQGAQDTVTVTVSTSNAGSSSIIYYIYHPSDGCATGS